MSLTCPSCQQTMHSVIYHGAKAKFCLKCKDFFLKPEQLETIKNNSEIDLDTEAPKTLSGGGEATYRCPGCDSAMTRETHGKILKTDIDICTGCKGIRVSKPAMTRIEYDAGVVRRNRNTNSGKRMTCPKCGLEQAKAENCKRCSIFVEKYRIAKKEGRTEYKKQGFFEKLGKQLEARILEAKHSSKKYSSNTRSFFDACQENRFSFYLMKLMSWALIIVCVYMVSLVLLYIFSNISMAPPKPSDFERELSRVSIFYIFAICMAGPVVLVIAFVTWRLCWYSMYGPIQALVHRFFHPLIKPVIAIGLLLLVLQSVSLIAHGFWTTYWWLNQQVEQAKTHKL